MSTKLKKCWFTGFAILGLALLTSCGGEKKPEYIPIPTIAKNENGEGYVGSQICLQCHAELVKSHSQTAHFKTSMLANDTTVLGSLEEGNNTLKLNDKVHFKIIEKNDSIVQQIFNSKSNSVIFESTTDIVIGSGTKGQSYLNWSDDALFQQQVSYYEPTQGWINSPMYPKGKLIRPRPVIPLCIGCHATYARPRSNNSMDYHYDRKNLVLGIDCERCHGPAQNHVTKHTNGQNFEKDQIISFKQFTRQQRLDACAVCHSGLDVKVDKSILDFKMGDALQHTKDIVENEKLDVHGNQYGLLIQSKCFKESPKMDCTTCHNAHKNERAETTMFSQICASCHSIGKLTTKSHGLKAINDCISCHMPQQPSKTLLIDTNQQDSTAPLMVRTHHIKVYPDS